MAVLTKEVFERAVATTPCNLFVHPWAETCSNGTFQVLISSFIGCAKFSAALCILQIAVKGNHITKKQLRTILEHGFRLTFCGASLAGIFLSSVCMQRKIFGRLYYYTILTIPGFLSGLSIFVLQKAKRHMFISALACSSLETIVNAVYANYRKVSIVKRAALFMTMNSIFLYFLKLWKLNKNETPVSDLWFFSPNHTSTAAENGRVPSECINKKRRPCNHIQSCFKSILKESSNYFVFGTVIEIARMAAANFKTFLNNPKKIIPALCKKSTLRLAIFGGLYVFLYKITNCALCRVSGKDQATNSLISGFVSGLAYYVHPNLQLSVTVFVNLIHILWRYFNLNEKLMHNFPTSELLFMVLCGFLFHYRVMAPEQCSKFFVNLISWTTGQRADEMYSAFRKIL